MKANLIKRETIIGARRFKNYILAILLFVASLGFILSGLSSYSKIPLLPFDTSNNINFLPQGLLMLFYGSLGLICSLYIFLTILWNIGSGYNEFDKVNNSFRLVRRGFPGKNRDILIIYALDKIRNIEIEIVEGINLRRTIYLRTDDQRRIPLTGVGEPLPLVTLEEKAITLAKFLDIPYTFVK